MQRQDVDISILFILSEEQEFISSDARFHMVSGRGKGFEKCDPASNIGLPDLSSRFPNLFYERKKIRHLR